MSPHCWWQSLWRLRTLHIFLSISILLSLFIPKVFPESAFTNSTDFIELDEYELPEDFGSTNAPPLPEYPPGATSLTFVFDETGSMNDDLQQVQEGAVRILEATTRNADTPIYNFVLVPFKDPNVSAAIETRSQEEFLLSLDDLTPQAGGDCPEMSVSAIKIALEVSLPGSQIYVFTDARAKDHEKKDVVLKLIQETESQVIFVLTGDCDDSSHEGYQVYEDIASTSSGQVFNLNKSDVGEILKYVELSVQTRKVNLLSADMERSASQNHWLPVDTRLQQFTISLSGDNPSIVLRGPHGEIIPILPNNPTDPPDGPYLEELLSLGKAYIVAMRNPPPGKYNLNISSTSPSTTRVQGISLLDFKYGFTTQRNLVNMNVTSRLPLRGVQSQLLIGANQLLPGGYLTKVEFLNMKGHIIPGHEYILQPHPTLHGMYTVPDIITPGPYFHIRVKGIDHQNYNFQRITAAAVSSLVPASPQPRMSARTPAFFGETATLNCFVDSMLPFTVEWRRDEEIIGTTDLIGESSNVQFDVGEADSSMEGIYSCIAHSSDLGRPLHGRAETHLDVKEPVPDIVASHNVTVLPGMVAVLTCHVTTSTVLHNITWDRRGSHQRLSTDSRVRLLRNGSLIIKNIRPSDNGRYQCIARNEGGTSHDDVLIIVQEPPVVTSTTMDTTFMAWENVTLACFASGVPQPMITWTKDSEPLPEDSRVVDNRAGRLILRSMTPDLAGMYRCHATNDAGTAAQAVSVTYLEVPSITPGEDEYLVAPDQTAVLPCRASGSPPPRIMWFKDNLNLSSSHYTHITEEGDLVIRSAHVYDKGEYVCVAANDAGSDSMSVTLNVGTEPRIIQAPSRNTGDDYGQNVTLSCIARGDPRPTIRWEKINSGGSFTEEGRIRILPSGHLFIQDLAVEDRGAYICYAENRFGSDTAYTQLRVTGLAQPSISAVSPIETVTVNKKLTLLCEVVMGNPPPEVDWYLDGQPMSFEVGRHTVEDNGLVIERVLLADAGRYTCVASNEVGNASVTTQLIVQVPPEISDDTRQSYTVIQTKSVTITCPATGFPRPRIQWFFRGVALTSNDVNHYVDGEGALTIPFVTGEDRGTYTCRVISPAGRDELVISLFVLVPPSIDGPDSLISINATENNPVLLPCEVRSNPPSQIRWTKDGELLPYRGRNYYYQSTGGSLNFLQVEESDRGYYVCIASNEAGNTTKNIELEVHVVPRIRDTGTRDVSVIAGDALTLECEAYGNPEPMITWRKDGAPVKLHKRRISKSSDGTLTVRNTRPGDSGSYSCIASNEAGSDSRGYRLSVYTAPNITEPYQYHSILVGRDVTLYCGASGFPDPEVEWFFNDIPVSRNLVKYTIEDSIGSLQIHSTTVEDTGVYQCQASNPAGSATGEIELAVNEPPSVSNGIIQVVRVQMGDSADLVCEVHSTPPPEITWQLGDEAITSSASMIILPDNTLRITRASASDSGYYNCIATNIVGSATRLYQLVVHVPPTIAPGEEEEVAFVGEAVRLMCEHDGFPDPTVIWMKGEEKVNIANGRKYVVQHDGALTIYGLQDQDSGDYTCIVNNHAGIASRTIGLSVLMPPTILETPSEHTVLYRNSVTLHCEAEGIPPPRTIWMKDGAAITEDDIRYFAHPSGTLRITSTVRSDTGIYTCLIANTAGSARKDINLHVVVPPEFNEDAEAEYNILLRQDLTLPCGVDGYPPPEVTWYKNDNPLTSISPRVLFMSDSLALPQAQVSDSGLYRCFVAHSAGNLSRTFRVNVQVPPRIDPSLTTIRALIGEDVVLPCEAMGVPVPEVMWTMEGQKYPPADERIQQMELGSLSITTAREEDSGKYLCIAVSDAGSDTKIVWLEVNEPPRITTTFPPDITLPVQSLIRIPCEAQGRPRPEVTWYKGTNPIELYQNLYTITTEGTLIISSLQPGDDGVYTCLVTNQWGNDSQSTRVETLVRPHIVGENTEEDAEFVTAMQGKTVTLECNVTDAHPPATIVWWKDNRRIDNPEDLNFEVDSGGRLLTIPFIQHDDVGDYQCVATNTIGQAQKHFTVSVQEGPVIVNPSWEQVMVMAGDDVSLACDARGTPPPRVSWHFEEIPLSYNNRRYTFSEGAISRRHVEVIDTGLYTCVAKNHAGSVNRTIALTVLVPPSIDPGRQNFAVPGNSRVTLPCEADGVPTPEVTWEKDGVPIDVDQPQYEQLFLGSLTVYSIQEDDAGTYICTASNDAGEVNRSIDLQVYTPPTVISSIPKTTTAPVGEDVIMACPITGTPTPFYLWKKNNRNLLFQRRKYSFREGGQQLVVQEATLLDSGEYVCTAKNRVGMLSVNVNLQITAEPRIRGTHDNEDYPVQELDSIDLQCFLEEAHPPPTIEWYFGGSLLSENDLDVTTTNNGQVLQVESITSEEAGQYSCLARNAVGQSERVWNVDVLVFPTIDDSSNQVVEVRENQYVILDCPAEGNPPPTITWTKDGAEIHPGDARYRIGPDGSLEISETSSQDSGEYACIAANTVGEDFKTFTLDVLVPPVVAPGEEAVYVTAGFAAYLHCQAVGFPTPRISWQRNSRAVPLTGLSAQQFENGTLRINSTRLTDSGVYLCRVENTAGDAFREVELVVNELPRIIPPSDTDRELVKDDVLFLDCPVYGSPLPMVTWLKDDQLVDPSIGQILENGTFHIPGVQTTDSGTYTCLAMNMAGNDSISFQVSIHIKPRIVDQEISLDLSVYLNEAVTLTCEVLEGSPTPRITWLKDGRPIPSTAADVRIRRQGERLSILQADIANSGRYTCVAENVAGVAERFFGLLVMVTPSFGTSPHEAPPTNLLFNERLALNCDAHGVPPPMITWLKDDAPITLETTLNVTTVGHWLFVEYVQEAHNGIYTCVASSVAGNSSRLFTVDVLLPPDVEGAGTIYNLTVNLNELIELTCETDPDIPATISWYHDDRKLRMFDQGRVISKSGNTLMIQSAQTEDGGEYHCEVTNEAGSLRKYYSLDIYIPGHSMEGNTDLSVVYGTVVTLECQGFGYPPPTTSWSKDGNEITSSSNRYTLLADGTLIIPSVENSDAGLYQCTVSNIAGQSSRSVTIEVQVPARILSSNQQITVIVNSSTELPCVAEGSPKPMIVWRKDRQMLDITDGYAILESGFLRIESTELEDSGLYSCVAKNEAGSDIMELFLEVQVPPEVMQYHLSFSVEEDSSVVMECLATGIPEPTVTWHFGDSILSSASFQYNILSSGALEIPIARREDRGEYVCIASNPAGEDDGIRFLDVTVAPIILMPPSTVTTAEVSTELTLRCDADGIPPPTVIWLKEGQTIRREPRLSFSENGSLTIDDVQPTDAGVYTCVAMSVEGRDSVQIEVFVHVPPRIISSPADKEVVNGDRLELTCEASGYPSPEFTWYLNRTEIPSPVTINGRSTLVRENVVKGDSGTYMCEARNIAGHEKRIFAVGVRSPPTISPPPPLVAAPNGSMVEMQCSNGGDPTPGIRWYWNGQPVQLDDRRTVSENGSLLIYNTLPEDTGQYRCQAYNVYGVKEIYSELRVDSVPFFVVEPEDTTVDEGNDILLDCQGRGEPAPTIRWMKGNFNILPAQGVTQFMNNSLLVGGARFENSGEYICEAINVNGAVQVVVTVTVRVHGGWSEWESWGSCSTSCGPGFQSRPRFCNQPEPANGGMMCAGPSIDSRPCEVAMCPIHGGFGDWTPWSQCSVTCGSGEKYRSRECNNPIPQYGGSHCVGRTRGMAPCTLPSCPVDGGWGRWHPWQPCSKTCGEGIMQRVRRCDSPPQSNGGAPCEGLDVEEMFCKLADCRIDGGYTPWTAWATCSKSCGSGIKKRSRVCSNPPPAFGGADCQGTATERMVCRTEPCPIHGDWSPWGSWSLCTASCDGGFQQRFRSCNRPEPQHNGRQCPGNANERRACNPQPCSTDGNWGPWSRWGECSATCGESVMRRHRLCNNPTPQNGGRPCIGDTELMQRCDVPDCIVGPQRVFATVVGTLNGVEIADGIMRVNISNEQDGNTRIRARVHNVPLAAGHALKVLLSILSPAYWTSAFEVNGAANGYSLTGGSYLTNQQVTFPSGEKVSIGINSQGVDANGTLQVVILVNGNTPEFNERDQISFSEFSERYIQTGPGELYGSATKMISVNNMFLPVTWNASVFYETGRRMPYLVQSVRNQGLSMNYHLADQSIGYGLRVFVSKGDPSNHCPQGFYLDRSGPYCTDVDECTSSPCSHDCSNYRGGYVCTCPSGYQRFDQRTCIDIDECQVNNGGCMPSDRCKNNEGSYRCLQACPPGYQETGADFACRDINECDPRQQICSHQCRNTGGSYQCLCPSGFRLRNQHTCMDIDECLEDRHSCSAGQECNNTIGHHNCIQRCQTGFAIARNGSCADVDECRLGTHNCGSSQTCQNMYGRYACICHQGYRAHGRRCLDLNECIQGQACMLGICINTDGGYECICPRGMSRLSDRKSCTGRYEAASLACETGMTYSRDEQRCVDINECNTGRPCQGNCINTYGSFRCTCPSGLRSVGRECADIDECALGMDHCSRSETCLNNYGSYRCENLDCPRYYVRNGIWECRLDCRYNNPACANLDKKITYLVHNTTNGILGDRDLIELRLVRERDNRIHTNTYFEIIDQQEAEEVPFGVRNDANGIGVIFTTRALTTATNYRIKVRARGYESQNQQDFQTTFILFISVSAYTYT